MKLLFCTCLEELKTDVMKIFHEAGIKIFSITKTTGVKDERDLNMLDDWFGSKDGEYDSIILFSFTGNDTAAKAMELVKAYNQAAANKFPVRAFIMPVEDSNYLP